MSEPGGQSRLSTSRVTRHWWGGVLFAAVAIAALLGWPPLVSPQVAQSGSARPPGTAIARRETRPTLDPARFVGKARLAHQVAREIPEILDQLYCYCECDKHVGHKSLLSCYTDGHAAT